MTQLYLIRPFPSPYPFPSPLPLPYRYVCTPEKGRREGAGDRKNERQTAGKTTKLAAENRRRSGRPELLVSFGDFPFVPLTETSGDLCHGPIPLSPMTK